MAKCVEHNDVIKNIKGTIYLLILSIFPSLVHKSTAA